jgi:hypothetical protein
MRQHHPELEIEEVTSSVSFVEESFLASMEALLFGALLAVLDGNGWRRWAMPTSLSTPWALFGAERCVYLTAEADEELDDCRLLESDRGDALLHLHVRVRSGRVAQLVAQLDHRDALLRLRLRVCVRCGRVGQLVAQLDLRLADRARCVCKRNQLLR